MEETLPRGVDLRRHFSCLRSLMVDCSEVDWVTARTAHKQVLLGIHYRRFTWLDQRGCIDAKRDAIPREAVPKALPAHVVVITPCPLYQSENCQLSAEHVTDGITYTNCCGYCQRTGGKKHDHPDTSCNKKRQANGRKAKNAKRRKKSPQK